MGPTVTSAAATAVITFKTLTGKDSSITYNLEKPMWEFCKDTGTIHPGYFTDEGKTNTQLYIYQNRIINCFANRITPIGTFITDPSKSVYVIDGGLNNYSTALYRYNSASPEEVAETDRSVCVLCLEDIDLGILSYQPMASIALQCSHAFHTKCLKSLVAHKFNQCLTCCNPISCRDLSVIKMHKTAL